MMDGFEERQNNITKSFISFNGSEDLLALVFDSFPYPIEVYGPDGTTVLVNKALLKEYNLSSPDNVVGKYNIFKDPDVLVTNQLHLLRRAFQGEAVFVSDVKVPLDNIAQRYCVDGLDVKAVYQDITIFPIFDDNKRVIYVVAFLVNRRVYSSMDPIEKAKEFIETHWLEKYDANKTAKAACLSKSYFSKLFKKRTGVTPYEYYINYKIDKLKEKLLEPNLSISQAFSACNMEYNGHYARIFKEKTGVTPSVYRELSG
jgi:AraC family transcriptional regulator